MHPPWSKWGRPVNYGSPLWQPLDELAPEHVSDFGWRYEVELKDGTRLHAYKHHRTRRYLHLDRSGRAFVLSWGTDFESVLEYEEVNPQWLLCLALEGREVTIVGQKFSAELKRLSWARSATRHRISRERARQVIENVRLVLKEDPPLGAPAHASIRLVFLGTDKRGCRLEVMAIQRKDGLRVIHAMSLRKRYQTDYEEVQKCRK